MKITSYGLFWRRDVISWEPGSGNRDSFRLLGRLGANRPSIKIADFRHQQGIYILFDDYGPSYVGLTRKQGLGKRLKDHTTDDLREGWDRFSWFGFNEIGAPKPNGISQMLALENEISDNTQATIGDLEALLIRAIGPKLNTAWMKFKSADQWDQVADYEEETYLPRVLKD
jgi:hypothetical protein